ncbi:MAG TPA: DUF2314 domain-containing protein [Planctomycetaceae bacterium]|jgi:uncharacterized protein YegJ (DUF2314 family)
MRLWQNIRKLFQRRSRFGTARFGRGIELTQSGLRPGRVIQPEQVIWHCLTVVFARADVDDATYRLLGNRRMWREALEEDRGSIARDVNQQEFDELLLTLLEEDDVATIEPPRPSPPLPLETLSLTTVGYNELVLDLAERCDQSLRISVCDLNSAPMPLRTGWPLAHHLARLAARETGGLILDQRSERWWSVDRWAGIDPDPGQGAIGDWIAIHDVAGSSGPSQMHTHGMLHFGLPDLELVDVPRFHRAGAAKLINAACLKLITKTMSNPDAIRVGDELTITGDDVRRAMHSMEDVTEEPHEQWELADGRACVRLVPGDPQAALVENRLLRILPAARYGRGTEALSSCLLDLFPQEDQVCDVADQDAMQSAHRRALATLASERERFHRGLRPGERLAVKVRFPYGGQGANEYMWVEVQFWNGEGPQATIEGVLLNRPLHRADLKLGQSLCVAQPAVYDWLRITASGRQEGNFTAAALET